jgi:hypothetical protein
MAQDNGTSGVAAQEPEKRPRTLGIGSPLQQYRLLIDVGMHRCRHRPAAGRLRE